MKRLAVALCILYILVMVSLLPGFDQNPTLANLPENTALDLGEYDCAARTDVDVFHFDLLKWINDYYPTQCSDMNAGNLDPDGVWASTGHPYSVHTYDKQVYCPNIGKMVKLNTTRNGSTGNNSCISWDWTPGESGKIHIYDPEPKQWEISSEVGMSSYGAGEYDPVSGMVIYISGTSLYTYDPVNDVKTGRKSWSFPGWISPGSLNYYPPTDKFYYISTYHWQSCSGPCTPCIAEITLDRTNWINSTVTNITAQCTGDIPDFGAFGPSDKGFIYDTTSKIIGGGFYNNRFYAFDPQTLNWTSQRVQVQSQTRDSLDSDGAHFYALDYDPVDNVIVFFDGSYNDRRVWAYKYKNGTSAYFRNRVKALKDEFNFGFAESVSFFDSY